MAGRKIKLLVVDDEKEICEFVKLLFSKRGFLVYTALSGGEAINIARKARPEIILIDIHLEKGIDGLRLLKQIRGFLPGCRCIMVTWDKAQAKIKEAKKLGAVSYLAKPLTVSQLFKTVDSIAAGIEREAQ